MEQLRELIQDTREDRRTINNEIVTGAEIILGLLLPMIAVTLVIVYVILK